MRALNDPIFGNHLSGLSGILKLPFDALEGQRGGQRV